MVAVMLYTYSNTFVHMKISLKFVHNDQISNKQALVQIINWHQTGDKPLPESKKA